MDNLPVSITGRRALAGVLLLIALLVLAGKYLIRAGAPEPPPRSTPIVSEGSRASESPKLVVHVVGAVRRPGLYRLREGSRIADALARAGGATRKADLTVVNLAAPLSDGVQVVVPRRLPAAGAAAPASAGAAPASGPVHLNTATLEQLDALPGIGPVTAQKILDYRAQNGGFASVDELDAVPGIGPARMEQLREAVTP